jgi:hypothetical protein
VLSTVDYANFAVLLTLMEIDGNGFDETYHWEYVPFSLVDVGWVDGITGDRCHNNLGSLAPCAAGSVRFVYD